MHKAATSILVLCSIFLYACHFEKKDEGIPKGILSIDAISEVLFEFSLAESAANLNIKNVAQSKLDSAYAFNPLKENHIRLSQFDSSISFYCHHSDLYKKVYERVLDKLQAFESSRIVRVDSIKTK